MCESKIFQPYKALGYVSNDIPLVIRYISTRNENLVVTCTGKSFHTYSCSHFNLLSISGYHKEDITCLAADNFHIYSASGNQIYAWRRGNEIKHIYNGHGCGIKLLLPFGIHIISVDNNGCLQLWDIKTEQFITELYFNPLVFMITTIMHPSTYINKILLGSDKGTMQLWNISSMKLVYTFDNQWNSAIHIIEQAPAVDVVAIGFVDGRIIMHNLKMNETYFEFKQDYGSVTSLSFRNDGVPMLASGTLQGHIVLWDLEKKQIKQQITRAHNQAVTGMKFLSNEPLLVSSSSDNSLKLWIFDMVDGAGRLLRNREGHAIGPTYMNFYNDDNILSVANDSTLRVFSTITEIYNKNLGKASFSYNSSKKKNRLIEDPMIMPPMIEFVAEKAREKEWDNIAARHSGLGVITLWSYKKLKMSPIKLLSKKIKHDKKLLASSLCITQCGNFVIIGYSCGFLEKFNVQSGIHRGSYGSEQGAHIGPVSGVAVDCTNENVISTGNDAFVKVWPFKAKKCIVPWAKIHLLEPIELLRTQKENSLIAVTLLDFSLQVIDIVSRRIIRSFRGHQGRITDFTFSPDSRWLITTSMDSTIRVWDIPSSQLIDLFQVSEPCNSLSISSNGEFLATTHTSNLGIHLWRNCTLYSHVSLKAVVPNEDGYTNALEECLDYLEQVVDNHVFVLNSKLISLSNLPPIKWLNLLNMNLLQKKNEPKWITKQVEDAPFFLPTISSLETKFDFSKISKSNESSITLPHPSFQNLTTFGKLLQESIGTGNFVMIIDSLKCMSTSKIGFELHSLTLNLELASLLTLQFMKVLKYMFLSRLDFELAQIYLGLFLKIHRIRIMGGVEVINSLSDLHCLQLKNWQMLKEKMSYNISVTKHLKISS